MWVAAAKGTGEIVVVDPADSASLAEVCRFRAAVWAATLESSGARFEGAELRDAWDAGALHWVVLDESGQIAASARLVIAAELAGIPEPAEYRGRGIPFGNGPVAAPDRIVVRPDFQQRGLASRLLEAQEVAAQQRGAEIAVRQASPAMVRRLLPRGWVTAGPARPDPKFPGVNFTVAYKQLACRP